MGITIHYRGRLADLARAEDFEDRLLDLALEFGGQARIWRSPPGIAPERVVRGIVLDLTPGLESTSMLLSPEGWLINLIDIEDAEQGRLDQQPWCFTKTQFGPIDGHIALIAMLTELQKEFIPDLEVSDEGNYWETRDLAELMRHRSAVALALDSMSTALNSHGLSREAAEDPAILARHIERVAARVQRILRRAPEHPPVEFPEVGEWEFSPEEDEARWDAMYKQTRRQQERLHRALEERRRQGEDEDEALENALRDIGIGGPEEEEDARFDAGLSLLKSDAEIPPTEVGRPSRARHPLLRRSMDLLQELHTTFRNADPAWEAALETLFRGAGDVMGGLAQALSPLDEDEEDDLADIDFFGLHVVQIKRALRGAAYAIGALCSLRSALPEEQFRTLTESYRRLERDIFNELARLRSKRQPEE